MQFFQEGNRTEQIFNVGFSDKNINNLIWLLDAWEGYEIFLFESVFLTATMIITLINGGIMGRGLQ